MNCCLFAKQFFLGINLLISLSFPLFIIAADLPGAPNLPALTPTPPEKTSAPVPAPTKPTTTPSPAPKAESTPKSKPKSEPATEAATIPTPTPNKTQAAESKPAEAASKSAPKPTPSSEEAVPTKESTPSAEKPSQTPAPLTTTSETGKEIEPTPTLEKKIAKEKLDTIDLEEGGNWLLKRKALEDTADVIEKIVNNFSKILEASSTFKIKRNKLDNDYDLYIATIGFNLGDLDQVLTNLMNELERESKEEGGLSSDERSAMETLKEKKNDIKQLQEDLKALAALDEEIDKVVDTVDSQIKTGNNYQNQAWKNFQEIKKVLSDEKAEELYYRTLSLQKSMQEIYTYLTTTLSTYFSNQIQAMRSKMDSIKGKVQSLQTKGVDLQKEIEKFEQEDVKRDAERAKEEQDEAVEKAVQEAKQQRAQASWWTMIKNVVYWPFVQLANLWNYSTGAIMNLFKTKPVKKVDVTQQDQPVADEPSAKDDEDISGASDKKEDAE